MDFFAPRIVLRPQEISNNPGIMRRLGVITHEHGPRGGHLRPRELDARRRHGHDERHRRQRRLHAQRYLSLFMCAVGRQGRKISPSCRCAPTSTTTSTRCRWSSPSRGSRTCAAWAPCERAEADHRQLRAPGVPGLPARYVRDARPGHIRHDLRRCFELHRNLMERGRCCRR